MLEAGIDVSGNKEFGNCQYIAIVIGTQESINSQMRRLGSDEIHMKDIYYKKNRRRIFSELDFTGDDMIAFCLRIEQKQVIGEIMKKIRSENNKNSTAKIRKQFNKCVWYHIKNKVNDFIYRHQHALDDIGFQSDQDCRNFLKDVSLKCGDAHKAHSLSDAIAWFNHHNEEPKGVCMMDLHGLILAQLKKEFK